MSQGDPQALEVTLRDDGVLHVRLNRPDVHNAFNETVIAELHAAFERAATDDAVRACLLTGNGKSFSAGADISWMREQGDADHATNVASAERMARMFHAIWACPKPVLAGVHGAALGGGTGLTAVADVAIAAENAKLGFTEVRLGIIPAVISPYVVEKVGTARARALFVLGHRFSGEEAARVGLVFEACPAEQLAERLEHWLSELLRGAPGALTAAKTLTHELAVRGPDEDVALTARHIANARGTAEAQEGLAAFLEKRPAAWTKR